MNLAATRVVLRPRGLFEVLDLGLRFDAAVGAAVYRRLALLVLLPAWLGCTALALWFAVPWPVVWTIAIGLVLVLQGVFTIAASRLMVASQVGVGQVLARFLRRLPSFLVASLVSAVINAIGWALFYLVVPAALATSATAHVPEASLVEEAGPFESIARARALARHQSIRMFFLQLLRFAALAGFVVGFELLFSIGLFEFGLQLGRPFGRLEWGGSPFALAGLFAGVPYFATSRFLHYIDTRTRQDGWDVQVRCMAVAAAEEGAA